jgi:hypothetical protein
MGYQINFYFCKSMEAAIETEASRIGAKLVANYPTDINGIQFSRGMHGDKKVGRLWTEAVDLTHYKTLCRAVKKGASYDRASGLWVKNSSGTEFRAYRDAKEKALADLVERNKKYAVEILGARIVPGKH